MSTPSTTQFELVITASGYVTDVDGNILNDDTTEENPS